MRTILIIGGALMLFHAVDQAQVPPWSVNLDWLICGATWWMGALCWK